jgi:hypothetical protein
MPRELDLKDMFTGKYAQAGVDSSAVGEEKIDKLFK